MSHLLGNASPLGVPPPTLRSHHRPLARHKRGHFHADMLCLQLYRFLKAKRFELYRAEGLGNNHHHRVSSLEPFVPLLQVSQPFPVIFAHSVSGSGAITGCHRSSPGPFVLLKHGVGLPAVSHHSLSNRSYISQNPLPSSGQQDAVLMPTRPDTNPFIAV